LAVAGVKVIGTMDKVEKLNKALILKGKTRIFVKFLRYKSVEKYAFFNYHFSTYRLPFFPQKPVGLKINSGKLKFPIFIKIVKTLDL
jgi:hypothetical protein